MAGSMVEVMDAKRADKMAASKAVWKAEKKECARADRKVVWMGAKRAAKWD
jgi:hypothetical protein